MDAKTMVSLLIVKLQNLFPAEKGLMDINPRTETQVKKAINNLQLWKRCLKDGYDSMNDGRMARLLQAYYSAEDAIDLLFIREKLDEHSLVRWPLRGFKVLFLEFLFSNGMKKFENVVRGLPLYDSRLGMEDTAKKDIEDASKAGPSSTRSLSSGNDVAAGEPSQQKRWRRISDLCSEEETNIEGLERKMDDLLLRLIPERNDNENTTYEDREQYSTQVIALIGEGGSGKTTMARKLYNRVDVKRHFSKHAWVHIPSVFKARDVLAEILIQIDQQAMLNVETKTISEEELMRRITRVLQDSRFLIVMENVETSEIWESLLGNFCSSTQHGKIIITTCTANYEVPRDAAYSTLHVRGLNNKDSWKLFLEKARVEQHHFLQIYVLMNEILNLLGGLPLRIVLLAGLLFTKVSYYNRAEVIKLENNINRDILALCYEELPSELRPCFLYVGIFPREYEIPVRRLIHLWCAEGFVPPLDSQAKTSEDLAEMYFEELVTRNMIQVIRWRLDGTPKTCRMSGVLYDFLSPKAAEVGCFYHQLNSSHPPNAKQKPCPVRRLAVNLGGQNQKNIPSSSLHLRSYIAFDSQIRGTPAAGEINMFLQKVIDSERKGFGMLKVLDLEGVYKPEFPKAVAEQLPLLRYLGLRSTSIDCLPDVQLLCLETLDVRHTKIRQLPSSLRPKRHIYLNWFNVKWSLQESDVELQTLWGVYMDDENTTEFSKLVQSLRRLGLKCHATSTAEKVAGCLPQLAQLRSLKLRLEPVESNDDKLPQNLLVKMAECSKLQELSLHGKLPQNSEIDRLSFPPNLTTLTLSNSNLQNDPMPVLGSLQHLKILRLFEDSYEGTKIACLPGGFPKLLVLKLWSLRVLENWTVEEGALPCLRELEIRECQSLLQLPENLKHLTTLTELVLTNMPSDFKVADGILSINVFTKKIELHPSKEQNYRREAKREF